jgi:hypothetical protein
LQTLDDHQIISSGNDQQVFLTNYNRKGKFQRKLVSQDSDIGAGKRRAIAAIALDRNNKNVYGVELNRSGSKTRILRWNFQNKDNPRFFVKPCDANTGCDSDDSRDIAMEFNDKALQQDSINPCNLKFRLVDISDETTKKLAKLMHVDTECERDNDPQDGNQRVKDSPPKSIYLLPGGNQTLVTSPAIGAEFYNIDPPKLLFRIKPAYNSGIRNYRLDNSELWCGTKPSGIDQCLLAFITSRSSSPDSHDDNNRADGNKSDHVSQQREKLTHAVVVYEFPQLFTR